jgi:hypothetical protein
MELNRWKIVSNTSLVVATLVTFGRVAAYAQVACPSNIAVEQKAAAPNDWTLDYSKAPAPLSSVTIFEGAPEEQASLKYDNERATKDEIIQTWELPASERGYWIICGYSNTSAQLRRKLPNDIRACEVVLEKGVSFGGGGAVVKRARCGATSASQKPTR